MCYSEQQIYMQNSLFRFFNNLTIKHFILVGKDASQEFEDVGHGSAARLMLDEFYVGELDPNSKVVEGAIDSPSTLATDSKDKSEEKTKFLHFLLALGILGLALGVILFNFST